MDLHRKDIYPVVELGQFNEVGEKGSAVLG